MIDICICKVGLLELLYDGFYYYIYYFFMKDELFLYVEIVCLRIKYCLLEIRWDCMGIGLFFVVFGFIRCIECLYGYEKILIIFIDVYIII